MKRLLRSAVEAIAQQERLDPSAKALQKSVQNVYAAGGAPGRWLKNVLHGLWLGHPLHAVITDVPVGAWTAAMALDTLEATSGREELGPGADTAIAVGIGGALVAALAGLTDWYVLRGERTRRIGFAHMLLNVAATLLYTLALLVRRRGSRGLGRAYAAAGYAAVAAGAYLGGDLVYHQKIGVEHADAKSQPQDFMPVLAETELTEGAMRRVEVKGQGVLLAKQGQQIYALADSCSHLGCSLAESRLDGDSIVCHCHGSRFALQDGHVLDGPSVYRQPTFETRVRDGQIEIRASAA